MELRGSVLLTLATAALAAAGCSWHRPGEANAAAPAAAELPAPEPGWGVAQVLALAEQREAGDFAVDVELRRVARVREGVWEDVPARAARSGDFSADAGADYVVVVRRGCRDWEGRERWSDERASWFLLPGGSLAAFDHWTFGPRCALGNAFRPLAADAPSRLTERDLLRWLEQRHPPGRIPTELRFQRGRAFAAAGRIDEAKAMLRFGDDALQSREDLFEKRDVSPEEAQAFEAEGQRLRGLRGELRAAIRRAEDAAAEPGAP